MAFQHRRAKNQLRDHTAAHARERRSQLRGLLLLAAATLLWILFRADRHAIFHMNWWRP